MPPPNNRPHRYQERENRIPNNRPLNYGDRGNTRQGPLHKSRQAGLEPSKKAPKVSFVKLWAGYPSDKPYIDAKTGKPPKGFENQCAIKVSVALHAAGIDMKSFNGDHVRIHGKNAAIRAEDLASWLKARHIDGISFAPMNITGEKWQEKINGKTGIVSFKDYWTREGETEINRSGDHIDLWNETQLTASGLLGALTTFARFTIGIRSISHLYSDLGNSKQILFWEVK